MLNPDQLYWLEDDLLKAREMLERFTPALLSPSTGFDCAASCRQLVYIGGDYYDLIARADGTSIFAIGDVSGKGISAALMLATLRASLHGEIQRATFNLVSVMSKLNKLIHEASPQGKYITLFYAQYDPQNSRLHYVNAGHNYPLLFRRLSTQRTPKELSVGGMPLGMMLNTPHSYQQGTETIRSGDMLVAYTDGITEITDPAGNEWGVENLTETIYKYRDLPSKEVAKRVLDAVDVYSKGTEPVDDMTLLVLKALR